MTRPNATSLVRRSVRRESNRAFPQADAIAMAGYPQPGLSQPPVSPNTGGFFVLRLVTPTGIRHRGR